MAKLGTPAQLPSKKRKAEADPIDRSVFKKPKRELTDEEKLLRREHKIGVAERKAARKRAKVEENIAKAALRKKLKNRKKGVAYDEDVNVEDGINEAIARMDARLLADYVAQRTKMFEEELSIVELEERYLPERVIMDTSGWEKPRTLENLPAFLEKYAGGRKQLRSAAEERGAPHTLVITSAGMRAAELTRTLRTYQENGDRNGAKVGKLFAKHTKLKIAVQLTKKFRMNIGVGTPQRLIDLLDDGALSAKEVRRIVIDASHSDQKKRGVLDMRETQVPLVKLLTRKNLKERYGSSENNIDVIFY